MKHGTWRHGTRRVLQLSLAGCCVVLPQAAWADDEIRTSADVSASGGWSSNPFAEVGKKQSSAFVQVDVRPVISLVAEHSIISLTGLLDYQHYFHDYADSNDYGGGLDYTGSLSSRLTTHAAVRFDSAIIGGFDAFSPATNPTVPIPPVTTGPDIALVGLRDRRRTLAFSDETSYSLSAYDSITGNAYYNRVRYGGVEAASDYNSYGGGVGYSRRVSSRLQLGLQGGVSRYTYRGPLGNSNVYSLQATFKDQISDAWNVSGAVGVSFSDQSPGGKRTDLTGNVQVCRQSPRATLCLNASDAVLPTGGTGTVNSKSVGGSYSYHLTERSSFSLSAQYSHNDSPIFQRVANQFNIANSYVTVSGSYDRQLRQRIHLIASTHYRKLISGEAGGTPADFGGSIGILIRFGDTR